MWMRLLFAGLFLCDDAAAARPQDGVVDVAHVAVGVERVRVEVGGRAVVARRERAETTAGGFAWTGTLEAPDAGFASFAAVDGVLTGTVRAGAELAALRGRLGAGVRVESIDPGQFATCAEPEPLPFVPPAALATSALATASTIDVLVIYTPFARATEGGTAAMEALIDLAVAETNQAYASSGVLQRVRLVARHEVPYSEASSIVTDLARLTIANDGWLDQVPALRDACGADAVALIIETGQSCGVANSLTNQGAGFAPYAFCVVARNCAAANLTLAHELGHVMGLAHDRDVATNKCARASVLGQSTQVPGPSALPAVSRTGAYVAFTSTSTGLVGNDTNGVADTFLRDRGLLSTQRASVSSAGAQANGPSIGAPALSNGTLVAFASAATNLVAGDTNGAVDVFLRNTAASTTVRILAAGGAQADGDCTEPSMSGADRWVVFTTAAPNLGASPVSTQVCRFDALTGATALASVNTGGQPASGASGGARASDDGRWVAFWSAAPDLVANDANGTIDVFVRDMQLNTTARVSLSTSSQAIAGPCEPSCAISPDGRWIAFASSSPDIVAGDGNGVADLFVRDRIGNVTLLASANGFNLPGNGASCVGSAPSLSFDGRRVAFTSAASDLVPGDGNGSPDVFVRDLVASTTERVSVSSSGAEIPGGGGDGSPVGIDAPGLRIAFASRFACSIADTNTVSDVYVFDRSEPYPPGSSTYSYGYRTADHAWRTIMAYAPGVRVPFFASPNVVWQGQTLGLDSTTPFGADAARALNDSALTVAGFRTEVTSTFCAGDGSATPCPCGNASPVGDGAGCANSLGLAGRLTALGGPLLTADTLVLRADGMPNTSALWFQGTGQHNGGAGSPFGDGLRCAGGAVQRLGTQFNVNGASTLPSGGSPPLSVAGGIAMATTVNYQVWYRNAAAFCTASTFNLTNGLAVLWH